MYGAGQDGQTVPAEKLSSGPGRGGLVGMLGEGDSPYGRAGPAPISEARATGHFFAGRVGGIYPSVARAPPSGRAEAMTNIRIAHIDPIDKEGVCPGTFVFPKHHQAISQGPLSQGLRT